MPHAEPKRILCSDALSLLPPPVPLTFELLDISPHISTPRKWAGTPALSHQGFVVFCPSDADVIGIVRAPRAILDLAWPVTKARA